MSASKKNSLSLREKVKIINKIENGIKQSDVASELNLPRSTVCTLWSKRKQILEDFESGENQGTRKRMRESSHPELERAILQWFKQMRSENVAINGPLIKTKAAELAERMNIPTFANSEGWLTRFKARHGIVFRSVCGEAGSIPIKEVSDWKENLSLHIKDYQAKDIFNIDETGLFYKAQPSKSLHFRGEKCTAGKLSKLRMTVLVGANMDGSEKLPLLVIGKSKKPRCFKGVKSMPTKYEANQKSWMTMEFFEKYVRNLDTCFSKEKRKVLLFMDNCKAHPPQIPGLKSIKIVFFPPNCTSVLQPMDQGIIKSLKLHYRKLLLGYVIKSVETSKKCEVNILQAMEWIHRAWLQVSSSTIANCFIHAGFNRGGEISPDEIRHQLALLSEVLNEATAAGYNVPQEMDVETFITFDDELISSDKLSDEEIIDSVRTTKVSGEESSDSDDGDETIDVPSAHEARNMLSSLRRYYQAKDDVAQDIFKHLAVLENDIEKRTMRQMKQKKITTFFCTDL